LFFNIEALIDKEIEKLPLPENLGEAPLYEPEKKKKKPNTRKKKKRFNPKYKKTNSKFRKKPSNPNK